MPIGRGGRRRGSGLLGGVKKGVGMGIGMAATRAVIDRVAGAGQQQRNWSDAQTRRGVQCFNCGKNNNANTHFCGHCGADMFDTGGNNRGLQCADCGFVCREGLRFCGNCGGEF